jgi:hypothetical protein
MRQNPEGGVASHSLKTNFNQRHTPPHNRTQRAPPTREHPNTRNRPEYKRTVNIRPTPMCADFGNQATIARCDWGYATIFGFSVSDSASAVVRASETYTANMDSPTTPKTATTCQGIRCTSPLQKIRESRLYHRARRSPSNHTTSQHLVLQPVAPCPHAAGLARRCTSTGTAVSARLVPSLVLAGLERLARDVPDDALVARAAQ